HPHRRRPHSTPTGDLPDRYATNALQPKNFAHLAHGGSLCGHPVPPLEAKGADLSRPAEAPTPRARSSRNGGRHHLGTTGEIISESVGGIIPERRAASSGIGSERRAQGRNWSLCDITPRSVMAPGPTQSQNDAVAEYRRDAEREPGDTIGEVTVLFLGGGGGPSCRQPPENSS